MKININTSQLIKFGSYLGNFSSKLDNSNIPYVYGIKNKIAYIDPGQCFASLKKLAYIDRKINSKNEGIYVLNSSRKDRYIQSLKTYLNRTNLNQVKNLGHFKSGIISNKEIRKHFSFFKKAPLKNVCYSSANNFFLQKNNLDLFKREHTPKTARYETNRFPVFMNLLKYDHNLVREFKRNRILTSCLLDTNNFHHVSDYNILYNNKSVSSNSFLVKILKN